MSQSKYLGLGKNKLNTQQNTLSSELLPTTCLFLGRSESIVLYVENQYTKNGHIRQQNNNKAGLYGPLTL